MKKKSILLTCIVAIMALAMFVGCDNAPVFPDMPKSVKGGYLTQTGVILTGQEVTADKFTLTVEYDNGDEPTVMPATNIQLDGTGNVFAVAGLDSDNNPVDTEKLLVAFTDANRIEATGFKESYTVAEAKAIKPSDIQVTAYYGTDGSVALTSSEFTVTYDTTVLKDELVSPSHPTEQVEITVHPTVGVAKDNRALDETYVITVKYAEAVEPEYAIASVDSVKFVDTAILKGLAYDEIPVPSFDDVEFKVTYDNGEKTENYWVKLTEESGVTLSYVDSGTKLELNKKNLVKDNRSYEVKAVYNDESVKFDDTAISVTQVSEVRVIPVEGYKAPVFKAGDDFVAPVAEDFDVVLAYDNGSYERLDAAAKENFVFSYVKADSDAYKSVDEFVEKDVLVVKAEYMGVAGYSAQTITVLPEDAPVPQAIKAVKLVPAYQAPAKQSYYDVNTINQTLTIAAIDSITVSYDKGDDQVITDGFTSGNLSVEYSLTSGSVTKLDKDSLVNTDTIYIHVVWYYLDSEGEVQTLEYYEPVEQLNTAYASALNVIVDYDKVAVGTETPMYGTTYKYTVNAVNVYGVVSTLNANEYTIDGTLPETVTKAVSVPVNAFINTADGEKLMTANISLVEPMAYISAEKLTLAVGEGEAITPYLVGSKTANHFNDDTAKKYVVTGYTSHGDATVTIRSKDAFALPVSEIKEGENSVYAYVSYVDENGRTQNNVRVEYKYTGVAYTETDSIVLVSTEDGCDEIAEGKMYYGKAYDLSKITWDTEVIKEHGDDAKLTVKGYCKGDYKAGVTTLKPMSGSYTDNYAGTINFVIGYTNNQGAEAEKVFPVTLTEAPRN